MNGSCRRAISLAFAGALVLAGCQGSKGDAGATGSTGPGGGPGNTGPVGPPGNPGVASATSGLHVEVVSVGTTSPITVRFELKDDRGYPVDLAGVYSVNTVFGQNGSNSAVRFALAYTTTFSDAGNTLVAPYVVLTNSGSTPQPTAFSPGSTGQGTIAENGWGAGDYTYTFPASTTAGGAQAVAYDPTKLSNTHVLWIQATRQTNLDYPDDPKGFTAVNQDYWFVPAGGTPQQRELVKTDNCSKCHRGFKPGEGSVASSTFHGGTRVDARFCGICHNPGRVSNPAAEAKVFVHRIHNSARLQAANVFHSIKIEYPQDIRNCAQCHQGALQGDQYLKNPTIAACGSCHDYVSFTGANAGSCSVPATVDANGIPVPCNHLGGVKADGTCSGCHSPATISGYHLTVAPPADNNVYLWTFTTGTRGTGYVQGTTTCTDAAPCTCTPTAACQLKAASSNTNAAWLAAAKAVPTGAKQVTYEVKSVERDSGTGNPVITFRFLVDGTATPMQTYAAGTTEEIFAGFVGSPSVYFAYAVPQDGVTTPADFNASASGYIRNLWNGVGDAKTSGTATTGTQGNTACTAGAPCTCSKASPCLVPAGTIAGPDPAQYYTVQLTGVVIPASATMLTGGVGYTYSLGGSDTNPPFIGNTQPLTQVDLGPYPYTANACVAPATCGGTGGLIVPAPNVWKVANGFTGRRPIVDNAKCQTCHVALGAEPSFHAGQRNDGPTCSFCHTPNRTSSGWSASAKGFIHALHAGRVRTVPFNWHAPSPTETFADVEFPGPINDCTACHYEPAGYVGHTYAFTGAALTQTSGTSTTGTKGTTVCTAAAPCTCSTGSNACVLTASGAGAFSSLLPSTVGAAPSSTVATYGSAGGPEAYTLSPYVNAAATYGAGFSVSATGTITPAATTTLVISPIMAACVGCHDSAVTVDHMQANGGKFYEPRSTALGAGVETEQCLLCHGAGSIASIAEMHR